jgi:small conductance mechanosensitive channel
MNINNIEKILITYGAKVLIGILLLLVGLFVIKQITKLIEISLKKKNVDETLRPFFCGLFSNLLKIALVISILELVGFKTTSFIAILGAAGLAVGMALQGSLSNFAGGILLLIFRPFNVGQVIQAQGYTGSVTAIGVFCTELKTPDNRTIYIPNGPLAGGSIVNFSKEDKRRVDLTIGIAYSDDLLKAKNLLLKIIEQDSRIIRDPEPFVRVGELADSSVNFTIRVWVQAADYWGVHFDLIEKIKLDFDKEGFNFPFPQQDIHIFQNSPT